jgi:hypothetical protein
MSSRRPASSSSSRRVRPVAPSCRGGVSSLLRLAPAAASQQGWTGRPFSSWLSRAARVLVAPQATQAVSVRPSEFAPSQWLVGH